MVLDSQIVKELVEEIAGKDVVNLVELIKGKENVSEFKIAEKLNLTVNQVRNMLYRLYSHNLVSFTRKKDKRKGWYIYYWTFDERKGYNLFLKLKSEKLNVLKERLVNEGRESYFICSNQECGSVRMNLEGAMENDFKCPDCGKILEQENNPKRLAAIEREIDEINKKLTIPFIETVKKTKSKKRTIRKKPKKVDAKKITKKAKGSKKPPKKTTKKKNAAKPTSKKIKSSKKPKKKK